MFMKTRLFLTLAFSVLLSLPSLSAAPEKPSKPVRILSVNVRLSTANDGDNAWPYRREFLATVIARYPHGKGPYDFVGTQETVLHRDPELNQRDFLAARLRGYDYIGRSRGKDPESGEAMVLFWKKDRWRIDPREHGTFWLSETPDVPGSKAEGAAHPRTAVFGLFHEVDKAGKPTGKRIYVYDTHLDHISETARQRGAKALMQHIAARKDQSAPVVLMGDLNCTEKKPAVLYIQGEATELDGAVEKSPVALVDTFFVANPKAKHIGTFNGFKAQGKKKIDYIFASSSLKTLSAQIIYSRRDDGGFPTDHFPIEAVLTWEK